MSARVMPGRSWTNKIRLGEENTNLDVTDPVGAAAAGATVRKLNSCRTIDDIGNVLAVAGAVTTTDATATAPVTIARKEYTILTNSSGKEFRTADTSKVELLINQGFTIDRIEEVEMKG